MKDAKIKFLIIGHTAYDYTETPWNKGTRPGGAAYYVAVGAHFFSKSVGVASPIGADYDKNLYGRLGVNTLGLRTIPNAKTTRFYHEYGENLVERKFRPEWGAADFLTPDIIPDEYLSASYAHICTAPPQRQIAIAEYLRRRCPNMIMSIDTLEDFIKAEPEAVRKAFSAVDIAFLNAREHELLRLVYDHGEGIVIKRGARGAIFMYKGQKISWPAPKIEKVVDKTGSGDVLAGALMAQLAEGVDHDKALKNAIQKASESITELGVEHLATQ